MTVVSVLHRDVFLKAVQSHPNEAGHLPQIDMIQRQPPPSQIQPSLLPVRLIEYLFAETTGRRLYFPGDVIMREGSSGILLLLRNGEARVDMEGQGLVETLGPGAVRGELSVVGGPVQESINPCRVTARTLVDAQLVYKAEVEFAFNFLLPEEFARIRRVMRSSTMSMAVSSMELIPGAPASGTASTNLDVSLPLPGAGSSTRGGIDEGTESIATGGSMSPDGTMSFNPLVHQFGPVSTLSFEDINQVSLNLKPPAAQQGAQGALGSQLQPGGSRLGVRPSEWGKQAGRHERLQNLRRQEEALGQMLADLYGQEHPDDWIRTCISDVVNERARVAPELRPGTGGRQKAARGSLVQTLGSFGFRETDRGILFRCLRRQQQDVEEDMNAAFAAADRAGRHRQISPNGSPVSPNARPSLSSPDGSGLGAPGLRGGRPAAVAYYSPMRYSGSSPSGSNLLGRASGPSPSPSSANKEPGLALASGCSDDTVTTYFPGLSEMCMAYARGSGEPGARGSARADSGAEALPCSLMERFEGGIWDGEEEFSSTPSWWANSQAGCFIQDAERFRNARLVGIYGRDATAEKVGWPKHRCW